MWRAKFYLNVHDVTTFVHFHVRGQMCHSLLSKLTGEHVPRAAADSLWVCHFAVCNTQTKTHYNLQLRSTETTIPHLYIFLLSSRLLTTYSYYYYITSTLTVFPKMQTLPLWRYNCWSLNQVNAGKNHPLFRIKK